MKLYNVSLKKVKINNEIVAIRFEISKYKFCANRLESNK